MLRRKLDLIFKCRDSTNDERSVGMKTNMSTQRSAKRNSKNSSIRFTKDAKNNVKGVLNRSFKQSSRRST